MNFIQKRIKNEDGQVLVMAALLMVALLGFSALAMDVGMMTLTKTKLQAAADSAALAGAQDIAKSASNVVATNSAKDYLSKNGIDTTDSSKYNITITGKVIKVQCRKTVKHTLAGFLGVSENVIAAEATAEARNQMAEALGYTLFAGEGEANLTGAKQEVTGGIYGDTNVIVKNQSIVTGKVETNGSSHSVHSGATVTGGIFKNTKRNMPGDDFKKMITGDPVKVDKTISGSTWTATNLDNKTWKRTGDLTVDGTLTGKGILWVTGSITLKCQIKDLNGGKDTIIYSEKDITFNGHAGDVVGLLYAPNGTVTINGVSDSVITGRVIAKEIKFNGAKGIFKAPTEVPEALKSTPTFKLTN